MGEQESEIKERRSKIKKKEDETLTIIDHVFKNKKIAVELLEVKNEQRLYRKYEDNGEDDRRIDDFINRTFKCSPEFEIKAYRKALYLIAEYESDIWYSFSKKEYKDKEKWFVDTLYNCSPEDLVISFPGLGAKEKKLKELKCRYEQERDLTVKRWIKLITFYYLVDEKAVSKKRYSELANKMLEKLKLEKFDELIKYFNYLFINSLMDFLSRETNCPADLYALSESKEEFDYLLKINKNEGLADNETIGILKNYRISEAKNLLGGTVLFIKHNNDRDQFVKRFH